MKVKKPYGPEEDMVAFKKMCIEEISDWFEKAERPMSSLERRYYDILAERRMIESRPLNMWGYE